MRIDVEARVRRAEELFREGYNCSQSVILAFEDLTGVDRALLEKLSIGLGGGVGRLREVCGAVSGMAVLAGFLADPVTDGTEGAGAEGSVGGAGLEGAVGGAVDRSVDGAVNSSAEGAGPEGVDKAQIQAAKKKSAYSLVQDLAGQFREENGSIVCHELLGLRVNAAKARASQGAAVADGGTADGGMDGTQAYSPVPQERNEAYYKARPCQKLVGSSARIIAEYIAKNY